MKGCLRTIGAMAVIIAFVIIGYTILSTLMETNITQSPEHLTSTKTPITSVSPTTPTPSYTPEPESIPTSSKETLASTIELPEKINKESPSTELIVRDYTWTYRGEWSWEAKIPLSLYDYYQKIPRPTTDDYSIYVTHPLDDPYIDLLVKKIKEAAQQKGYTEYETIEFAAAFVQSLPYTVDSITTPFDEYPRYPIETLVDKGGDCEDTSILLASIIDKIGYGVVLIELPDHCAVGVKSGENITGTYWEYDGSKYYYIETTDLGWEIGKLPEVYENKVASIYPMIPIPVLTHNGNVTCSGYFAIVEVTVSNLGTASADNVCVLAGFDAGGGMVWNSQQSEPFTIGVDQKATVNLNLNIPLGKHTRLIVQIGMDNVLVDESYSEWFDT